jgi:CRP-like cAMP-binding protein
LPLSDAGIPEGRDDREPGLRATASRGMSRMQSEPATRSDAKQTPEQDGRGASLLLTALPPGERQRVMDRLEPVPLEFGRTIYEANQPITDLYFPTDAVISMVSDMEEGTVEVGTVGREGMSGLPLLLRSRSMPTRAYVQVPGHGLRMDAAHLSASTQENPAFERLLYLYAQALFDQVAQTAACNRLHSIEARCARWFMMTHDRVGGDVLQLKQKVIAEMLGVHRPAVTLAAGALQRAGFIRYVRGRVTVLDPAGLQAAACGCYGVVRRWFDVLSAMAKDSARNTEAT